MNGEGMRSTWTRSDFVRRAAGAGLGLTLGEFAPFRLPGTAADAVAAAPLPLVHRFHSQPDLVAPSVTVVRRGGAPAPGSLFLAPSSGPGQRGTLIMDDGGEPIWFRPSTPVAAMNFRVGVYMGSPVLTWWEGRFEHLVGEGAHVLGFLAEGTHVIADDHYNVIARFPSGDGLPSDMHECLLTPHGTVLVTAWETVTRDLRRVGGPGEGRAVGGVVQELDIPTGNVLFEWHSVDHVSLEESYDRVGDPFDYFHINSIAPADDGNLLVSARNTWTVYKIDRGSGDVIWRLGGKKSDFRMGPGTFFAWQHDARPHGERMVSLFDDGAAPRMQRQSRGLVLALDTKRLQATMERSYAHSPGLLAHALGSTQLLPNGNVLVGFGTEPYFTEYSADGKVLLDARLPSGGENYRALRFPWTGRPADRPRLALHSSDLYVSWNGATEVASWQLHTGRSPDNLAVTMRFPRSGFETTLPVPAGARFAAATALDATGKPLAASATIRI